MNLSIEPVAPAHFEGLWRALDTVAREKRFLAFTEAPPWESSRAFYEHIIANDQCQVVAVAMARSWVGATSCPAWGRRGRMSVRWA